MARDVSPDAMSVTYLAPEEEAEQLTQQLRSLYPPQTDSVASLIGPDGSRIDLPPAAFEALLAVVRVMARGEGVTLIPRPHRLTTQESADILGISRPTLVKLLESGLIPFEKHGRHRKVRLQDLLDYQSRSRKDRAAALDGMAAEGQLADMYDATTGPPVATR